MFVYNYYTVTGLCLSVKPEDAIRKQIRNCELAAKLFKEQSQKVESQFLYTLYSGTCLLLRSLNMSFIKEMFSFQRLFFVGIQSKCPFFSIEGLHCTCTCLKLL